MKKTKARSLRQDLGYWLNRLRAEFQQSFKERLAKEGVSLPEWSIMVSLWNGDATNVMELSRFIEVDKGAVSRTLADLEEKDLVRRRSGPDGRSYSIKLTKKGEGRMPVLAKYAMQNEEAFFGNLRGKERKEFHKLLGKILVGVGIVPADEWKKENFST